MKSRRIGLTATWLVLLTAVQLLALAALWRFSVRTEAGQWLDTVALTSNYIGSNHIGGLVATVLNAMSVASLVVATAVIGFIALIRRRIALAILATLLIAGANISVQALKYLINRPDLGIDPERAAAGNSLPSGHTAVAASVAVALILVLPRTARVWGAFVGAVYTALAGVATLSAGWHRPSDAIASLLIVGAWASLVGIGLLQTDRLDTESRSADAHRVATGLLLLAAAVSLAIAWYAADWTLALRPTPPKQISDHRLLVAYGGSALGITGTTCLIVGLVLATVHRVVPRLAPVAGPAPVRPARTPTA
ncbi:phosphatase PAP2 family protein [Plantactinospora siamensis]|uniref:Phosphatase PAP2 family protein n=1 Tax=Plantactinospora siamensis TaxID=555372 RepID=A0ABV6NW06_9ACTN